MLEVRNLNVSLGTKELIRNSSFRVGDTDRIGVVGLNGTGKSTLLKVLTQHIQAESGDIMKSSGSTLGFLPQEISFEADLSTPALDYVMRANPRIYELGLQLEAWEKEMAEETNHESEHFHNVIEKYTDATTEFERIGGFRMKSEAEKIMMGLGFEPSEFQKPIKGFSGGWQMRLLIGKLLLQNPTLLLLDEPTNHLDIDSLRWLENYLLNYEGSMMIVSHDRFFLDKLTTKTLEIAFKQIVEFKGNYSYYEKEKELRLELVQAKYQNDMKRITEVQRFVERFKAKATKARQAQSRMKLLAKLEDSLQVPEEDLTQIQFRFPKANASGKIALTLQNIKKIYTLPDGSKKEVLKGITLEIARGDRIAIVGSNGAGKSTLCKIISGELEVEHGTRTLGHNVSINYFAQHQTESLDGTKTILDEMLDASPNSEARMNVRNILGCFLFSDDDVYKKISVLSGGEKSRVSLAKILLQSSNLLIMDEPTNHLDIRSKEMLIESLENYEGTFLLVSHDRYFLDSLVNKVLEVKDGTATLYTQPYAEYLADAEKRLAPAISAAAQQRKAEAEAKSAKSSEQKKAAAPAKDAKKKVQELEAKIEKAEKRKAELEDVMGAADFYKNEARAKDLTTEYKSISNQLETLYYDWEKATAAL
jgi:ATP-binding cassette subfamily F protein 3